MQQELERIALEMVAPELARAKVFAFITIMFMILVIGLVVIFIKQHKELNVLEQLIIEKELNNERL